MPSTFIRIARALSTFMPHTGSAGAATRGQGKQGSEDDEAEDVREQLVVDLHFSEDVGATGMDVGDQAEEAEDGAYAERGDHDRDEHERDDAGGESGAIVLAVDEHYRHAR